jgi:hypothetical protein
MFFDFVFHFFPISYHITKNVASFDYFLSKKPLKIGFLFFWIFFVQQNSALFGFSFYWSETSQHHYSTKNVLVGYKAKILTKIFAGQIVFPWLPPSQWEGGQGGKGE